MTKTKTKTMTMTKTKTMAMTKTKTMAMATRHGESTKLAERRDGGGEAGY